MVIWQSVLRDVWKWRQNETSRRYVISEYLKLAYFICVYNFDSKYFDSRIEHSAKGIGKTDDTGTDTEEKEHERLRKIEKKWENKINGWIVRFLAQSSKVKGEKANLND